MSESQVYAYFIDEDVLKDIFASNNDTWVKKVFADPNGLISSFSPRFSHKALSEAIKDLIYDNEESGYPFHYSFAVWIIIDATTQHRPKQPHIPYPFLDLYDFNELLAERTTYTQLLDIFRSLNNEIDNQLPYQLNQWGEMPGFVYISKNDVKALENEIKSFTLAISEEQEWTLDIEEIDDILHILNWLQQAAKNQENLLLVMEGSL